MRDALSLLDQAIAHGTGKVEEPLVRDMLGTVDQDYLFTLLEAMAQGDVGAMLNVADQMTERSLSFDSALQDLAAMLTRLQVAQLAPGAIAEDVPDRSRLLALAAAIDAQTVQLAYQISVHGRHELPMAPDPLAGFVMTLLRLHAFAPRLPGEGPSPGKALAAPRAQAPAVKAAPSRISIPPRTAEVPVVQPVAAPEKAVPVARAVVAECQVPGDWQSILDGLQLSGMARALSQHCELLRLGDEVVQLRLPPAHRHLIMKAAQDRLQQSLGEYCGRPLQLQIEVAEVSTLTPAAILQQEREERQDRAVAAIEQDPFVREVIDIFDATLIESSIKPI